MAINKFTIDLSFTEVERVVTALRKLRDSNAHLLSRDEDGYLKTRTYNSETKEYEDCEPFVESWLVTAAESTLKERAELAEIIGWFTGEVPEESAENVKTLRMARLRLDAETAAKAEAEVN